MAKEYVALLTYPLLTPGVSIGCRGAEPRLNKMLVIVTTPWGPAEESLRLRDYCICLRLSLDGKQVDQVPIFNYPHVECHIETRKVFIHARQQPIKHQAST